MVRVYGKAMLQIGFYLNRGNPNPAKLAVGYTCFFTDKFDGRKKH